MKLTCVMRASATALMLATSVMPSGLWAADAVSPAGSKSQAKEVKPVDVSLADNGKLQGKLLDSQGKPVAGKAIAIHREGKQVAVAKSSADGTFELSGVRGGLYTITSEHGGGLFRLWAPRTGPPSATDFAVVYNDSTIVRGNFGNPKRWLQKPVLLGAGIAGAIALPIALHDDEAS